MAIFHGKCIENSVKLFADRRERQNATLVQYANGCIYAITKNHSLTYLDMNLQVQNVSGHRVDGDVNILLATSDFVAYNGETYNVTVHDSKGNLVLVSFFSCRFHSN